MRQVAEHVEFVHSLAAEKIHSLRTLGLVEGGEHLAGVHFLAAGALGVELRVLHDALQHRRQHRLDLGIVRQLLQRTVQKIVELLLQQGNVAAALADHIGHLAVVQQRVQQMLERDVLVTSLDGVVQREFEGFLEWLGDHWSFSIVHNSGNSCSLAMAVVLATFISATSYV